MIAALEALRSAPVGIQDLPPDTFFAQSDSDFDAFGGVLSQALLASLLLGRLHISGEIGAAEFAEGEQQNPFELGFDVEPKAAVDYLNAKKVVTRKQFDSLSADARNAAFTVSGVYKKQVLAGFKDEIEASLLAGRTERETVKRFREILRGASHQALGAFHLETVFRTNIQVAYGVGRRQALESTSEDLPFWKYRTAGDDRVRPAHAALNGVVLPANHEFWGSHFPPWSFNCRCTLTPVTEIPAGYDRETPSDPDTRVFYDERGNPAKAEIGTSVVDLAVGDFRGIPRQGKLSTVIESGVKRAQKKASLRTVLRAKELQIAGRATEKAYVFDKEGNIVLEKTDRSRNSVTFTAEQLESFADKILTHNHPSGGSLSPQDVFVAVNRNLAEMRAVGTRYRYSIKPGKTGWPDWNTEIVEAAVRAEQLVTEKFTRAIRRGKMTNEEAQLHHWHEVWRIVAARTGMRYRREEW